MLERVLMTSDTVGGVWTYSIELARALSDRGISVTLATLGGLPHPDQRAEAAQVRRLRLESSSFRLPWMENPWYDVEAAGRWLLSLASELRPDVVHINEPVFGSLPWSAPTVAVGHSCVFSWWEAVLGASPPPEWTRYREEMRRGLASADVVVAPSHAMVRALQKHYGVVSRRRVIPNGRAAGAFQPLGKEGFVLTAGRIWDRSKNVATLDRAAEGLPWRIYAAGDLSHPGGEPEPALRHLWLLGRLSTNELAQWLARAAIYALPARYEPFGLSVLEAALAGCALVLGDIPSLREAWDGVAVFVPPKDSETLRSALTALIEDAQLRTTLAMRARRRGLTFTPERMAKAYLDLYRELQRGSARPLPQETACAS
jgi:glycosyltransferase involved in cell wall biosynthesis